jgi:protein phosphatase
MPPEEAAETLVDLANFRGGPDNISVVIARVEGKWPATTELDQISDGALSSRSGRQMAPLWVAAGACLGILVYCIVNEWWTGAIVSAVGSVAALTAALTMRPRSNSPSAAVGSLGGPYGNGPYRKADCPPNGPVVESLSGIAAKLRDLPQQEETNWAANLNWKLFDDARAQAADAAQRRDYASAIRQYCQAIRDIMQQCREHRPTIDTGSQAF